MNKKIPILFVLPYFQNWYFRLLTSEVLIGNISPAIPYLRGFLKNNGIDSAAVNLNKIIIEADQNNNHFTPRLKLLITGQKEMPSQESSDMANLLNDFVSRNKDKIWETIKKMAFFDDIIKENLLPYAPFQYVGISVTNLSQLLFSLKVVAYIRSSYKKDVKIIFGGVFITENISELIILLEQNPIVDYLVIGEGESALTELIRGGENAEIPNLIYLEDGRYVFSKRLNYSENAANLPAPFYEDENIVYIHSARRCYWGKCIFCHHDSNVFTNKYIFKKPGDVINDIIQVKKNLKRNPELFIFTDKCLSVAFLKEFSGEIIRNKIKAKFACFLKFEKKLDYETLKLIKSAGFVFLDFGLETSSSRLLKLLNKNIDINSATKIIEICGKLRFRIIIIDMMIGLPTQMKKELEDDLLYMLKIIQKYENIEFNIHPLTVFKDSVLYRDPQKYKIRLLSVNEKISFVGNYFSQPFSQIDKKAISTQEAVTIYNEFRRRHGLRPEQWDLRKAQLLETA